MLASNLQLGLNQQQLKAVTAPLGPVLILAGAGSGKTRALTMRIVYLIKKLRLAPEAILAVTFTNKAAGEMKERIRKLLGIRRFITYNLQPTTFPTMGTFHSIGARILRAESRFFNLTPQFVIYDPDDQENILKDILLKERIDPTRFKPSLFAAIIDRAKNNLQEPEDLEEERDRRVYAEYQTQLNQNNAVDFGDLIMLPVKLFQAESQVLQKYQQRWQYVLVDEYQDTNRAQYLFAKLLVAAHRNIFAVGDDAQAIYGFRGANFQNILDFKDDYPKARIIRLEQNYRSTAPILAVAEAVIALSPQQHAKRLWTENEQGNRPTAHAAEDEQAEAWFVAKQILKIQDQDVEDAPPHPPNYGLELSYEPEDSDDSILSRIMNRARAKILPKLQNRKGLNQIAVLYRTHFQSRAVEELLIESSIPYQIIGGLKFYERREIKDILAYLRLLLNPRDLVSMKRVINVPPRGIGPATFQIAKEVLLEFPISNFQFPNNFQILNSKFQNKPQIQGFFQILQTLATLPDKANLLDVMRHLINFTGYEKYLRDGSEEGEGRWENVQELFNVAGSFTKVPWKEGLVQFLEDIALMTSADEVDATSEKVTLMTLHQAKGLEFDTVFLIGLEEGLLPHARSLLDPKDIAEEIRLAYVGVTRAKQRLYLVHAQSRRQFGSRNLSVPSRILKAIPEELLEIYE